MQVSVRARFACPGHTDDDLAAYAAGFDMSDRVRCSRERERPIDDGHQLAGPGELGEGQKILASVRREKRRESLSSEARQDRRSDRPEEHATTDATDNDERPAG